MKRIMKPNPCTAIGICFLTVAPLLVGFNNASAHRGDRVIPIYEITDDMLDLIDLKDGRIDEWEELFEPSLTTLDFFAYTSITTREIVPYDPSDLDFRIWLGWNVTHGRLYLSIQARRRLLPDQRKGTSS